MLSRLEYSDNYMSYRVSNPEYGRGMATYNYKTVTGSDPNVSLVYKKTDSGMEYSASLDIVERTPIKATEGKV